LECAKILLFLILATTRLIASESEFPSSIVANYYYDYSSENIETLRALHSDFTISKERLQKWDTILKELLQDNPLPEGGFYRICAYLYTAQRDAAFLSFDATQSFKGSLDPITVAIIRLFYPFFTPSITLEEDEYSYTLAQLVFSNFKVRFNEENKEIRKEKRFINIFAWTGQRLEYNKSVLGWTPWVISPISMESDAPPQPEDQASWKQLLLEQEGLTPSPTTFWAKRSSVEKDNWLDITNRYLYSRDISLAKTLFTRSILALALYDAIITNTKTKYFYSALFTETKIPSLKRAIAYTAASVLSYYFPKERDHWLNLAAELVTHLTQ